MWFVDDVDAFAGDGAQVKMAPGPESRHHVVHYDVEFFLIVRLHVEVSSNLGESFSSEGRDQHRWDNKMSSE